MKQNSTISTKKIVITALIAALTVAGSAIRVTLPIDIGGNTSFHLGNIMCALSGLLLGPWYGALAAGIGSMIYDFTNPLYIAESWITFLTKFFIGFLAGWIACRGPRRTLRRDAVGAAVGSAAYVVLYLLKSFIVMYLVEGQALGAVQVQLVTKGVTSTINGVLAVVASVALVRAIRPSLERAGVLGLGHAH